jgi:hypothetical protein
MKQENEQTHKIPYVKTCLLTNHQTMKQVSGFARKRKSTQTMKQVSTQAMKREIDQRRKRSKGQTCLLVAGTWQQTGLPANAETMQREYAQTLKQG